MFVVELLYFIQLIQFKHYYTLSFFYKYLRLFPGTFPVYLSVCEMNKKHNVYIYTRPYHIFPGVSVYYVKKQTTLKWLYTGIYFYNAIAIHIHYTFFDLFVCVVISEDLHACPGKVLVNIYASIPSM